MGENLDEPYNYLTEDTGIEIKEISSEI